MKKYNLELNSELAYIIGVMIGDGFCFYSKSNRTYTINLKSIDKDFIINLKRKIKKEFNKNSRIDIEKNKTCKKGYCYRLRCFSKEIFYIIESYKIEIIKNINNYQKNIQISFLNGLFDSEGYVSNPKNHKRIGIAMNNKKIILLCKKILSNNKINSHIYKSIKRKKPYYDLYICGRNNIILFQKLLSPSIKRKKERIDNLIKSYIYNK